MTLSAPKLALVEPAYLNVPGRVQTFGPEVADLAAMAGLPPDPEQELGLDALFAIREDGLSSAFEFAVIAARQNMKTGLFKMAALGWLYITEQRLTVWSAHEMSTTKEAFEELQAMIEGCAPLRKRLAPGRTNGVMAGNGVESIQLTNPRRRIKFKARTHGGGRGLTGDKVILDEAYALIPAHMGTLLPTLSAVQDPQVVYGSSAGHLRSAVLRSIRDRGRSGTDPRLAYMEFCAPLGGCANETCTHTFGVAGCALDDPENWRRANPAMDRRITREYIAAERRVLGDIPTEFARERLGWWEDPISEDAIPPVFTEDEWLNCKDPNSTPNDPVAFGVFLLPDRSQAAIAVAGRRSDWKIHVEIVPARKGAEVYTLPGTAWIAPRLKELKEKYGPCAVLVDGAADSLAPVMIEQGVEVITVSGMDKARACGQFYDAVTEEDSDLRHLGDDDFHTAATTATKRELRRGWVWADGTDVQLEAATVAVHGLIEHGPDAPVETEVWGFWE